MAEHSIDEKDVGHGTTYSTALGELLESEQERVDAAFQRRRTIKTSAASSGPNFSGTPLLIDARSAAGAVST